MKLTVVTWLEVFTVCPLYLPTILVWMTLAAHSAACLGWGYFEVDNRICEGWETDCE